MPKHAPAPIISIARACRLADCDYRTAVEAMARGLYAPDFVQLSDTANRAYIFFRDDRLADLQAAIKTLQSEKKDS